MGEDRYAAGMKVRRAVLGDAHVDRAEANKTAFDADFQRFITETAWAYVRYGPARVPSVWSRPGLDRRTRSLLTIAMMASLGREAELALHIRATPNTGASREDVKEVLMQVAVYAGVPAANSAVAVAKRTFAEMDAAAREK